MSHIIIDNQTDLPDETAIFKVVGCLARLEDEYEVKQEDNVFILKESNKCWLFS